MDRPVGTVEEVLAHFGVKGMHWGSRKAAKGEAIKSTISDDARAAGDAFVKSKKVGLHSLSNQELQDLVTRMNLEQQLSKLAPPSKKDKATKLATELLANVGKQQASKVANDLAGKAIKKLIENAVKK